MSVIKGLRKLSTMEFYKNAIRLRQRMTDWLLRDFGTKRNARSINKIITGISEDDQKLINDLFNKYGKNPKSQFKSEFPDWFVDFERKIIIEIMHDMIDYIISANSIYAMKEFEFDERRNMQNKAISCCNKLYQELQYIASSFRIDLNKLVPILDSIEEEVELIKKWRQSDNKRRKEIFGQGL